MTDQDYVGVRRKCVARNWLIAAQKKSVPKNRQLVPWKYNFIFLSSKNFPKLGLEGLSAHANVEVLGLFGGKGVE